jgi:uncharacterized repeat protein (TIGR01451 family)
VVDNIFQSSNPDFAANVAKPPAVDLIDFDTYLQETQPISFAQGFQEHGNRVTSIIGAQANNNLGIAGVLWNADLSLYSAGDLQNDIDSFQPLVVAGACLDAIADGARIVNASFGWDYQSLDDQLITVLGGIDQLFQRVIEKGRKTGVLWVFGAGNAGVNVVQSSPARLAERRGNDDVISVAAVESRGALTEFSDFGTVTLAAPGDHIPSDVSGGAYDFTGRGTSFSAPYVTGVAGLMLSINSALSPTQLKVVLQSSSNVTGRFDRMGSVAPRLLDACRAVKMALASPIPDPARPLILSAPVGSVALNTTTPGGPAYSIFLEWSDQSAQSCNPIVGYELEIDLNGQRFAGVSTTSTSATQTITNPGAFTGWSWRVTAVDKWGNASPVPATGTFSLQPPPPADLTISKTASPDPLTSGSTLTYTLTVQNIGGSPAGNVTVTDSLPAGLASVQCSVPCSIGAGTVTTVLGTIAASTQTSFTISGNAPTVSTPTTITNTAVVVTSSAEVTLTNNSAAVTTLVNPVSTTLDEWVQFQHDAQHTGRSDHPGPTTKMIRQIFNSCIEGGGSVVTGPTGLLYMASGIPNTRDFHLCILTPDGSLVAQSAPYSGGPTTPAVAADGSVYLAVYRNPWSDLYAFNADGTLKWMRELSAAVLDAVTLTSDALYVAAGFWQSNCRDQLLALNLADGTPFWTYDYGCTQLMHAAAVSPNGDILVTWLDRALNHFVTAHNKTDGTPRWSHQFPYRENDMPPASVASDGTIYVFSPPLLHALTPTGDVAWSSGFLGTSYASTPAIAADGSIRIALGASFDGATPPRLLSFSPGGQPAWERDFIFTNPSCSPGFQPSIAVDALGNSFVALSSGGCSGGPLLFGIDGAGMALWSEAADGASAPALASSETLYVWLNSGGISYLAAITAR